MYNERSLQAYIYRTINKRVNILLIKKGLTPKDKQSATAKIFSIDICGDNVQRKEKTYIKVQGISCSESLISFLPNSASFST